MLLQLRRHERRHLLHRRTPWLYFKYDHPLKADTARWAVVRAKNDFHDLEEEWSWLLDLPETD
jgi:hypothetical protein